VVSKLYSLKPMGIETKTSESLTSYISRVAEEHSITPGLLIGKIITPYLKKEYLSNTASRGGGGLFKDGLSLNGVDTSAQDLVKILEELTTRNDLSLLTLLPWKKFFPTRGLMRSKKAWCSLCLQNMKMNNMPIYEPLLWRIKEVSVCPLHHLNLITQCPTCNHENQILSRESRNGYCLQCSEWLGNEETGHNSHNYNQWDLWKADALSELIINSNIASRHIFDGRIQVFLEKASAEIGTNKFITYLAVPKSTYYSWIRDNKTPSIKYLLRILYCTGLNIREILFSQMDSIVYKWRSCELLNSKSKNHIVNRRFSDGYIEGKLLYWNQVEELPPKSVSEISKILGCDRKLLYKRNPILCKNIAKRHQTYISERAKERINVLQKKVIEAVTTLEKQGIYPSRRKVEEYIGLSGILKEKIIQKTWKESILF
jgi:hypothetical protein